MRPTPPLSASRPPARPAAWRTTGLLSLLALGVASPLAVLTLLGASAAVGQTARLGLAPGAHDEGVAVAVAAAADPATAAAPHGLALRRGCHWGQPGRKPYQGSVRQALQAAGLPEDVVAQIETQHRSGQKSGRLAISRSGIRHTGDGRVFPARGIALTYGMTLCRDATVNFAKGHVEMADLYEARDAQGKPHAVMVPDVCGNVSVLGAAGSRGGQGAVAGVSATLARRAKALAELADVLDGQAAGRVAAADTGAVPAAGGAAAGRAPAGGANAVAAAVPGTDGIADAAETADRRHLAAWPLLLGGGLAPGQAGGGGVSPAPLTALAAVTDLLVPPAAAAGVARGISRVTAATGRSLEALGGGSSTGGAAGSGRGGGGGGTAGGSGEAQAVPEPGSLSISVLALALLAWRMRRRRG